MRGSFADCSGDCENDVNLRGNAERIHSTQSVISTATQISETHIRLDP